MSEHLHKLNIIQVTIQELREAQSKQECSIAEILKLVDQVRTERTSHSRSSPIDSFGVSETEDCREPVSPLSEGGMSVTEYLNVRKLQIKASALIGTGHLLR